MAHADAHAEHAEGHGASLNAYFLVFAALSGFTVVSFVANWMVRGGQLSAMTAFLIILGIAVAKAGLVAWIFMHLKWDWGKLYFLILPAFIIAPAMILALLPDLVLYWQNLYRITS